MNVANFTSQNNDLNQSSCENYLNESSLSQESSILLINDSCTNIQTSKIILYSQKIHKNIRLNCI